MVALQITHKTRRQPPHITTSWWYMTVCISRKSRMHALMRRDCREISLRQLATAASVRVAGTFFRPFASSYHPRMLSEASDIESSEFFVRGWNELLGLFPPSDEKGHYSRCPRPLIAIPGAMSLQLPRKTSWYYERKPVGRVGSTVSR